MAGQGMLFKMPDRASTKESNKGIISKTTNKRENKVITVNAASRIEAVIASAKQLLTPDDRLAYTVDPNEFRRYMAKAYEIGEITIDTETTGLDPLVDKIVGVCLYVIGEKALYVPVGHKSHMTGEIKDGQMPEEVVIEEMAKLAKSDVKVIYHNAKFDTRMKKWNYGVQFTPYWDTMICSNCLNENESHNLKYQHDKYILRGKGKGDLNTYSKLFEGIDFSLIPYDIGYLYAAKDALMTYELYQFQKKVLERSGLAKIKSLFLEIEMPLIQVVGEMEDTGVCIDAEFAKGLEVEYGRLLEENKADVYMELDKIEDSIKKFKRIHPDIHAKLDNPVNISSPNQMAIILYDVLGLESPDKKKPRGTGADILKELGLPICKAVVKYKTIEKLMTTYIQKLPYLVLERTGRLHGNFNQAGTVTGRFSSSDPNLQNIPSHNKEIRKMFVAPEGYYMLGGDYSQQEPRCLAYLSGDENMLQAYSEGKDIYATIACKVYKVKYEDCLEFYPDGTTNDKGKERRGNTKSIVLGIMYGRGAASIAEQTGMTKQEAQGIVDEFFEAFPKVQKFVEDSAKSAKEFGFVETIWGRKRRLPDMMLPDYEFTDGYGKDLPPNIVNNYLRMMGNAGNKQTKTIIGDARKIGVFIKDNTWIISKAERQVVNSIIQGSSADMTKIALILIGTNARLKELGFKTVMTVHDEIIGIAPKDNAKECMGIVKECMLKAPTGRIKTIPFKCDPTASLRWYGEEFDL